MKLQKMKLKNLYDEIVKIGVEGDPRGKLAISRVLEERKQHQQKLSPGDKEYFDKECLTNPYADSRILVGSPDLEIKNILVGIDIDTSELLLASNLNAKGAAIDLVLSHHPIGKALANFYDVMDLQIDVFNKQGVALGVAENLLFERKAEVERRVSGANFAKTKDAAELLKLNLICAHTPADNQAYGFLDKTFSKRKPKNLKEVIDILLEIDEYKESARGGCLPRIINGKGTSRVKNLHYEFTGGTEGPRNIYEKLADSGVDTIIAMHLSEEHFQSARKANLNIILAGHIASDNLGMNVLLDKLQKKFKFTVLSCSGFKRFSH
ncbi:MAG: NGG1p interacting factor NIF3 [Candidatus Omnitrophica bacterium]|nr:NGG1p interacting factor NIF3 [Candidatus Omnitrophota bacterium]